MLRFGRIAIALSTCLFHAHSMDAEANDTNLGDLCPFMEQADETLLQIFREIPLREVLALRRVNNRLAEFLQPIYEMIQITGDAHLFWSFCDSMPMFVCLNGNRLDFALSRWALDHINKLFGDPEFFRFSRSLEDVKRKRINLVVESKTSPMLPAQIGKHSGVSTLSIKCPNLQYIPEEFGDLENRLVVLYLTGTLLQELPTSLCRLSKLKILHAYNNKLCRMPQGFGLLVNLQELQLSGNSLTSLSEEIGRCHALRELNVSGNLLTRLPSSLGNCYNLTKLNATRNCISSLNNLNMKGLRKLQDIAFNNNLLSELPWTISKCRSLKNVKLAHNRFSRIPGALSTLPKLFVLDMDSNPLDGVLNFPQFTKLGRLYLDNCFNFSLENLSFQLPRLKLLVLDTRVVKRYENLMEELEERKVQVLSIVSDGDFYG